MRKTSTVLVVVAGVIGLLIASVAVFVLVTIPPTPDPGTLPSQVLQPPADAYRPAVTHGQSIARTLVSEEKLPGLSLAVAIEGDIVWAEGFRWADMENETPVTPATLFRIGGVSATFTAAAAGLLSQRGRLDLDAAVQEYLPDFPAKEWPVSTRQLMAHTAGIRPHRGDGGILRGSCADDAARLALFADEPLRFRPGTQVQVSAWGWSLVGAVIAAAAQEPLADFMRREIFLPLGMQHTVADVAGRSEPGSARFYYPRMMLDPSLGLQPAPTVDLSCYRAAVGFLSTPSDLVRFGAALMDGTLLDPATVEQLHTPVRLPSGEDTGQALGWFVHTVPMGEDDHPTRIVSQGLGATVLRRPLSATTVGAQVSGGTAALLLVPEHRIAIAVATNVTGSENVGILATRLADVFVRFVRER